MCDCCDLGARVSIPNFAQIDELDFKLNLKKIESAGVSFPMGKQASIFTKSLTV